METKKNRSTFSGKVGFVLAAAGSAVGLGNLWRFPYLAAKYGGGIFLLVYIVLAVTFVFTLMVTEIAIGRKTRLSPMEAFGSLNKKWSWMGKLVTLVPVLILPYYCVIGGWVTKYTDTMISGAVHPSLSPDTGFLSGPCQAFARAAPCDLPLSSRGGAHPPGGGGMSLHWGRWVAICPKLG